MTPRDRVCCPNIVAMHSTREVLALMDHCALDRIGNTPPFTLAGFRAEFYNETARILERDLKKRKSQ